MKRAFLLGFLGLTALPATALGAGPITKGPWIQHVTSTSAVIRVEVDPPAPVTLDVGFSGVRGSTDAGAGSTVESREIRALHTMVLKGLEPATRYQFTVRAHGSPRYGAVTTAPREDSGAAFRFLVYGDNRTDDAAHAAVVRAMVSSGSDFLVNTGDMVDNGGSLPQWQKFFDIEAPLTRERPLFAAVGNHELVDGAGIEYVRYFGPAELPKAVVEPAVAPTAVALADAGVTALSLDQLSGTFRWSTARFFIVNGMVQYETGPTRAWLDKVLTEADKEPGLMWRILVVHHGPWSSGPHGGNTLLRAADIPQLLRSHKVDLVVSGHDHIYERGFAEGLSYLVSGGGGAPVYRVKKADATSLHYESARHFVEASVSGATINFAAIRPDGSVIERCALRKSAGWDCDAADASAVGGAVTASPSAALPGGAAAAEHTTLSRCGCRVVGGADGEGTGAVKPLPGFAVLVAGMVASLLGRRARRRSVR